MGKAAVYLNGKLVGFHEDPEALCRELRAKRRRNEISPEINIYYDKTLGVVHVNSDRGRARRPYIVVEDGKSRLTPEIKEKVEAGDITWQDLIANGIIEYLDAEEEEGAYIALSEDELTKEHTHLEFDPVTIASVVVNVLPYPNHNLSVRNTMACSMAKQSLGIYATNYNLRTDSLAHIMFYPQQPLVQTRAYKALGFKEHAAGENFVVAILSYSGYNMEDALIINRNAIDRGLARTVYYKTYTTEERRYPGGQKDKFCIPTPNTAGYREEEAYRYLDDDGIISPEISVKGGDVLVGKVSPPRFLEEVSVFGIIEEKKRENSLVLPSGEKGIVDSVIVTDTLGGDRMVKVRVRTVMPPEIGDKFASRHGQKGVIGLILPQEDMPFTKEGIVPDIILNPHAIPSRMTAGHLLDMLGGKAAAFAAQFMDGTAFEGQDKEDYGDILEKHGYHRYGKETMYDGITGKKMKADVFVGIVYYQRLRHLVATKIHARSRGPVQLLTHQPTEGRAREGGLRFGEMERDCLIGFGASMLIKERLLEESDKTNILVCNKCGARAVYDYAERRAYCPLCGSTDVHAVEVSYAFKLLLDEIQALGILPRLRLKSKGE